MAKESDGFVRAIARGFSIVEALGRPPGRHTLSEAAIASGLNRATARRMLATLVALAHAHGQALVAPHTLQWFISLHGQVVATGVDHPRHTQRAELLEKAQHPLFLGASRGAGQQVVNIADSSRCAKPPTSLAPLRIALCVQARGQLCFL